MCVTVVNYSSFAQINQAASCCRDSSTNVIRSSAAANCATSASASSFAEAIRSPIVGAFESWGMHSSVALSAACMWMVTVEASPDI